MKIVVLLSAGAFAAFGAAQDLSGVSECARGCIERMLALAPKLGCKGDDVACLCRNMDFGYGVRDCTTQACGAQDLPAAAAAAAKYCPNGAPSGSSGTTGTQTADHSGSPTWSPRPTTPTNAGSGSSVSTPYTTQAIVSTITSGTQVITTTVGSTTLYSPVSSKTGTAETTGSQSKSTGSSPTDNPNPTGGSETTGTGARPSPTNNGAFHSLAPAIQGMMGTLGVIALLAL
ncbi:hypothetical protein AJ78_03270 [Emergomyces pasteurianus Ep9510]|uniref:CFEM domain-containing protein n=1 Tax=Emergomyces pasteurianus Ep9510 TaxID=1447872 RepID=A0A1J9Q8N1_9EURO|nr:hypothetical protein AJ78_03270 [Emergomyces pasteurianus Ep9510]